MGRRRNEDNVAIRTMGEVADMLGVTVSAVHMCESNALRKLFVGMRDDPALQRMWADMTESPRGVPRRRRLVVRGEHG